MSHTVNLQMPSSSVVDSPHWTILLLLLLILPWPNLGMATPPFTTPPFTTPSFTTPPFTTPPWPLTDRVSAADICHYSETRDGGLAAHCSGLRLPQVPLGLSNLTTRLFLDKNLLRSLPADSFFGLLRLKELDLSHNKLSSLEAGCFRGVMSSLRFLDLSSNKLSVLDPAALAGLRVRANLTHNPWHCDCRMQLSISQLDLDPSSLSGVVCKTSDLPTLGAAGRPLVLLLEDWDLCLAVRRNTDVVMLVIMFLWIAMVITFLAYYIRKNQEHVRRHLAYLKLMQLRQV